MNMDVIMSNQENKKQKVTLSNGHEFEYGIAAHLYFNPDTNQYFVESNLHVSEIPKFLNFISNDMNSDDVDDATDGDDISEDSAQPQVHNMPLRKEQVN